MRKLYQIIYRWNIFNFDSWINFVEYSRTADEINITIVPFYSVVTSDQKFEMATKLTTAKRQSYTVSDKLRIVQFAEQNGNWAAEREFGVSESITSGSVISDGGHWGAFRKRSNEQLQVQQLQQIIVYIHLYTSVPADSWQQAQIPQGERRSNLNNWTISKSVINW